MDLKRAKEYAETYLMKTYRQLPVVMHKGRGTKAWDTSGKEYLDFIGGIATNVLGHCHPKVVVAIQKQSQRLMHGSNFFLYEPQLKLAKALVEQSFADKVFFANTGTEANEAAIKLARKNMFRKNGHERPVIISALDSFHGRTLGSLAATGQPKFQKGFGPMLEGFKYVPYNDLKALRAAVDADTCAIMLEPILGESGVRVPADDYLRGVRSLCDESGILMILDEIQTGMGRTGTLFAYESAGVSPDIMTLAKGLGSGMPIGAVLATDAVASAFEPGDHGSTFGGNPLACAAALATIETILEGGFILDQCQRMGQYMMERLKGFKFNYPTLVREVRGRGLLVAMELTRECAPITAACLEKGLLVNCTAGNVLRFMPPLIVVKDEIDQMVDILESVLSRQPR